MKLGCQTTPLLRGDSKRCGSKAKQENVLLQLVLEERRTPSWRRGEVLVADEIVVYAKKFDTIWIWMRVTHSPIRSSTATVRTGLHFVPLSACLIRGCVS